MIERFAYRPLRNAPRIAPLITALGVSFFLQNAALLLLRRRHPHLRDLRAHRLGTGIHLGPLNISLVRIIVILTAIVLMVALTLLVADDAARQGDARHRVRPRGGRDEGIDVDRVIVATFFIGSALAGAAGVMVGLVFCKVFHLMGFMAG